MRSASNSARELRTQCVSCGGTKLKQVTALYDQEQVQEPPYHLVRCETCGLEFISDPVVKQNIFQHYPTDNSAYAGELGETIPPVKRFLFWLDARLLLKYLEPGDTILDVGAGLGTFAQYLVQKGFKVTAVDFGPVNTWPRKNMPYIQMDLNQPLTSSDLLAKLGGAPKAVIMRHVLEHVYEPGALIARLAELKPGYFLIMVPNGRSWFRYIFGRHWGFFDPPRHLSNFSKPSLSRIFKHAGYGSIRTATYGMDEVAISLYRAGHAWNPSVRKWFSWTSLTMLASSGISLLFGKSVLVLLAKRPASN